MNTLTATRERPILFSGAMVRAILDGKKTQTRRVVKRRQGWRDGDVRGTETVSPGHNWSPELIARDYPCHYGQSGDRLWVRETWAWCRKAGGHVLYSADPDGFSTCHPGEPRTDIPAPYRWRPSIHMPRWASRLSLELTDVRVERVQDISEEDALAEGIEKSDSEGLRNWPYLGAEHPIKGTPKVFTTARQAFASLWDSLNEKRGYPWSANPWVWVVSFRGVEV